MLGFIGFDERALSSQVLNDYTVNLSGQLFDLPGGPVGIAIGYEHRFRSGSFTPIPVRTSPAACSALTVGVNNVFDQDPPACFSCNLNNYDPTTYDVPGRFGYLRLSYGL